MSEGTENAEAQKPSKYKGFGQKVRRVRSEGSPSRSAVLQEITRRFFKHQRLGCLLLRARGCRRHLLRLPRSGEQKADHPAALPQAASCPSCSAVLQALIERIDAKNLGNTPFPGFFRAMKKAAAISLHTTFFIGHTIRRGSSGKQA